MSSGASRTRLYGYEIKRPYLGFWPADLLQAARNGGINLSATLEAAVEHELRRLRKREPRRR